jgi:excisionase family DNA binding protein
VSLRVGGEPGDQGHGPLGDGRTLANWWSTAPAHHDAPAPSATCPSAPPAPPAPPAKTPPEEREYLSIATAAQYLDCSEGLIRKLLADSDPMPSFTRGRARRIPRAALDVWVARRMAAPVGVNDMLDQIRRAQK